MSLEMQTITTFSRSENVAKDLLKTPHKISWNLYVDLDTKQ